VAADKRRPTDEEVDEWIKTKPKKSTPTSFPRIRSDGELYKRPTPNPFSENWNAGFLDGYDQKPMAPENDKEYRDGYATGNDQRRFDRGELDSTSSSNT
jgi:hypothetical protein